MLMMLKSKKKKIPRNPINSEISLRISLNSSNRKRFIIEITHLLCSQIYKQQREEKSSGSNNKKKKAGSKLRIKIEDSSSENGSDDDDDEVRNNDEELERIVINKIEAGAGNFFKVIRKEINNSKKCHYKISYQI